MCDSSLFEASLAGFLVTFVLSFGLSIAKHFHGIFTFVNHGRAQDSYSTPTPRIGGIPLILGYLTAWFCLEGEEKALWGLIGLSGLPALFFGLVEDMTHKVSIRVRLIATLGSGVIFAFLSGYTITSVNVWGVDFLLSIPFVAVVFTAFAIAGVANAINLIDGFHGLASGTLLIILVSFGLVAWRVDDFVLANLSMLAAIIIIGFFFFNFPFGKIFLGDAGAYFCGFFVATLAVMLPGRNPEVSPWVSLLILGYPVAETLASIIRRHFDQHAHVGESDTAHLHHLVNRTSAKCLADITHLRQYQNPITSIIMWMMPVATLLAVETSSLKTVPTIILLVCFVVFYMASYRVLMLRDNNSK